VRHSQSDRRHGKDEPGEGHDGREPSHHESPGVPRLEQTDASETATQKPGLCMSPSTSLSGGYWWGMSSGGLEKMNGRIRR
jgi:hypothetical protein